MGGSVVVDIRAKVYADSISSVDLVTDRVFSIQDDNIICVGPGEFNNLAGDIPLSRAEFGINLALTKPPCQQRLSGLIQFFFAPGNLLR